LRFSGGSLTYTSLTHLLSSIIGAGPSFADIYTQFANLTDTPTSRSQATDVESAMSSKRHASEVQAPKEKTQHKKHKAVTRDSDAAATSSTTVDL